MINATHVALPRVLFITVGYPPHDVGGAERQAQRQAEALAKRGVSVHVVTQGDQGVRYPESVNGIPTHRLRRSQIPGIGRLVYVFALIGYLVRARRSYDLVHVHLANLQADAAVLAGVLTRKPVHVKLAAGGEHGEIARFRQVARVTRWVGIRGARSVQAISDEIERDLLGIGVRPDRIRRIPNGLALGGLPASASPVALPPGVPTDRVIVLYMGRLATYKGVQDLLDAWTSSAELQAQAHLLLVGPQAQDKPVGVLPDLPGVTYCGPTDEPQAYYAVADVLVLPSHAEGMSNTMLEAMASGIPIVATSVGAATEVLAQGPCGLLVPPSRPRELAAGLLRVVDDQALRRDLGAAARQTIRQFDLEAVVDALLECYRGMRQAPAA